MEEKLIFLICVLLAAVVAMALYLREIEKEIDSINDCLSHNLKWHNLQGEINDRTLKWCKNTDKTIDDMLETQEKLVEMVDETYTKYLEVQAQINGIKFMMNTYCMADECETPVQVEEQ